MSERALKVWIVEFRVKTEYGWSDWEPTYDNDAGPYDTAFGARKNAKSLKGEPDADFQYRAKPYVRAQRPAKPPSKRRGK